MDVRIRRYMLCLLLFVMVAGMVVPSFAAEKLERVAKLSHIVGDVQVKKAGGAKPFKAFNNMALTRGDQITTGKDSSAQLDLDDGSKLVVGSNSQSMISDLVKNAQGGNQTAVKVVSGQVWSKLQSLSNSNDSFKYETPTAVMGIRGTMLLIKGNSLYVTEGVVSVAGKGAQAQEALVKSNEWGEASGTGQLDGGVIDPKKLVEAMDSQVLHIATQDIIEAVYEAQQNPGLVKAGKGMSNEFLQQAADFVAAAKEKDPTIEVPGDFAEVVQKVAKQIAENLNNPGNPNPEGTISNGGTESIQDNQTPTLPTQNPAESGSSGSSGGTTSPTPGNSGGSGSGGGSSGGSGGGGGGGSSQNTIDTVTATPIGNGDFSRVTVKGIGTSFTTKPLLVNIDEKQWGDVPFSVGSVNTISDTELNFELSTPDDGRYKLEFIYAGKSSSYYVSFLNGPSRIESVTATADLNSKRTGTLRGRNLFLAASGTTLSIAGGNEKQSLQLTDFRIISNNTLSFAIPEQAAEGTYSLTLKTNGKIYTYPAFDVPLRVVKVDAVLVETTDTGRSITVSGQETHFKQNETRLSVLNAAGQEVYQLSGNQITVVSPTELRFMLPATVVGDVTVKIITKHEEGRGTLELPTVVELELGKVSEPLYVGQTAQLKAIAKLSDKTTADVTEKAVWNAAPSGLVTISTAGVLTASKTGAVTVTAAFEGKNATQALTIQSNIKELAINPTQATVSTGKTFSYRAIATLLDGKTQDVSTLATWSIADTSIATISGNTVTGVKLGTTTVTATIDKFQATAQLSVKPELTALAITPTSTSITVGQTAGFAATATYADNKTEDVTAQAEWSSSNAGVAQVSAGIVSGVNAGTATVTASYQGQTAQAGVTVNAVVPPQTGPKIENVVAEPTSEMQIAISGRVTGADSVKVTLTPPTFPGEGLMRLESFEEGPFEGEIVSVIDGSFTYRSESLWPGEWIYRVEAVKDGIIYPDSAKSGSVTLSYSFPACLEVIDEGVVYGITEGNTVKVISGKTVGDLRQAVIVTGDGSFEIYENDQMNQAATDESLVTNGMVIQTKTVDGLISQIYDIMLVNPPVPGLQELVVTKGVSKGTIKITAATYPNAFTYRYKIFDSESSAEAPDTMEQGSVLDGTWDLLDLNSVEQLSAESGGKLAVAALDSANKVVAYTTIYLNNSNVKQTSITSDSPVPVSDGYLPSAFVQDLYDEYAQIKSLPFAVLDSVDQGDITGTTRVLIQKTNGQIIVLNTTNATWAPSPMLRIDFLNNEVRYKGAIPLDVVRAEVLANNAYNKVWFINSTSGNVSTSNILLASDENNQYHLYRFVMDQSLSSGEYSVNNETGIITYNGYVNGYSLIGLESPDGTEDYTSKAILPMANFTEKISQKKRLAFREDDNDGLAINPLYSEENSPPVPPMFANEYPKIAENTDLTDTTATISTKLDRSGKVYYAVVPYRPDLDDFLSPQQIMSGKDFNGNDIPPGQFGFISAQDGEVATIHVTGLSAFSSYHAFLVAGTDSADPQLQPYAKRIQFWTKPAAGPAAPEVVGSVDNKILNVNDTFYVNFHDVFHDDNGDLSTFEVTSDDPTIVEATTSSNIANFTAKSPGEVTITLKVTDSLNQSADYSFTVNVIGPASITVNPTELTESSVDEGTLEENQVLVTLVGGAFNEEIGVDDLELGLPDGLSYDVERTSDTTLLVTIIGAATEHGDSADTEFTIKIKSGIEGVNETLTSELISVDFHDELPPQPLTVAFKPGNGTTVPGFGVTSFSATFSAPVQLSNGESLADSVGSYVAVTKDDEPVQVSVSYNPYDCKIVISLLDQEQTFEPGEYSIEITSVDGVHIVGDNSQEIFGPTSSAFTLEMTA